MAPNKQNSSQKSTQSELYPIRTVSSLTGVNAITLRAWERRYGIIKPVRTPKGHRLYKQKDIDLIQHVVELLDKGISIGQVKEYLQEKYAATKGSANDPWTNYQRRFLNAIVRFDTALLDEAYNEALSLYPIDLLTKQLILPLLITLGERWQNREGSVAEEHFFGAYLRNKLGARFHHHSIKQNGALLVASCMPGEHHEIGLMLFCLAAMNRGYRLVYLGADTPLSELKIPLTRTHGDAIVLSGSTELVESIFSEQLFELVNSVEVPVFIGGKIATQQTDALIASGAIPLGTDISQAINKIDDMIKTR